VCARSPPIGGTYHKGYLQEDTSLPVRITTALPSFTSLAPELQRLHCEVGLSPGAALDTQCRLSTVQLSSCVPGPVYVCLFMHVPLYVLAPSPCSVPKHTSEDVFRKSSTSKGGANCHCKQKSPDWSWKASRSPLLGLYFLTVKVTVRQRRHHLLPQAFQGDDLGKERARERAEGQREPHCLPTY
jgi:hypothetical protein